MSLLLFFMVMQSNKMGELGVFFFCLCQLKWLNEKKKLCNEFMAINITISNPSICVWHECSLVALASSSLLQCSGQV